MTETTPYIEKLSEKQKDALSEITNIATGKAILALSKMMDPNIRFSLILQDLKIENLFEIECFNKRGEEKYIGVRAILKQEIRGTIFIIFPVKEFLSILDRIEIIKNSTDEPHTITLLEEENIPIIQEIGNILISHYCSAIADFLSIKVYHDVPEVAFGEYTALLDVEIAKLAEFADQALIMHTNLKIDDFDTTGEILFIPQTEYLIKFLNMLDADKIVQKMN